MEIYYGTRKTADLPALLRTPLTWQLRGEEPTVLILHTHATESYTKSGETYTETARWRTRDETYNMLSIGHRVGEILAENGITAIHDRSLHDYPSYNGSYTDARKSIAAYLEEYPSIRLVLDRAATTQEAVDLLNSYDMFATSGRDYHFFVVDASGDARVLEYDPEQEGRPLRWTKMQAITNFYGCYAYLVEPNQKNGIYGHGRERYDAVLDVFEQQSGNYTDDTVWAALIAASQEPDPEDITSNTQWSIAYNNTDLTADIVLRRHWNDITHYGLTTNET